MISRYFTCHRHDIDISKNRYVKRRYDTILILSIYMAIFFSIYRPTSSHNTLSTAGRPRDQLSRDRQTAEEWHFYHDFLRPVNI